jgi:glyoxylase-like metal-dependent hydrolase (beta-lactamase superfamily II)
MKRRFTMVAIALMRIACWSGAVAAQDWGPDRAINQLTEHVYRWGADGQNGMLVVTPDGAIVSDGHYCERGHMEWLKAEIESRFDVPVKYVVLSHDHQSHICGTEVFAETAVAIGHKNIRAHILREGRQVLLPQITFEESLDIDLGGVKVTLLYLGPLHSDNLIQTHVPAEGVLFAPDFARGTNIFPDFRDMEVNNMLDALLTAGYMPDVEIVIPGHGQLKAQDNFLVYRRYLVAIRERMLEHIVAGRSLERIYSLVTMADFRDEFNVSDQSLRNNIDSMYDYLYRYREPNSPAGLPVRAVN